MSDFLAEARVLVRPDTTAFRAQLQAQLLAATKGVVVPVSVTPIVAPGVAEAAAATKTLATSTSHAAAEAARLAGAQSALDTASKKSTASLLGAGSATARLDAALLGLRTAIGSAAVIGLSALALAAIATGKAVSASVKNFIDFERELATFRATAGATAEEMRAVSEQAKALGADVRLPTVSAADAAVAMTELAKAGLTVEESMAGAEGVLQLATAAQISNADAAEIAANALNSFGLAGADAVKVADTLANAANAAQGSISDFGLALRQVAAVSQQVGVNLQDTTALLSLLAKNGLQGSDAGTSLRVALLRLVAPTKEANALIESLNLNVRDLRGNVRADVFAQFAEATAALGPELRDAAAAAVFGQDAIRAVAIAGREGADGLRLMRFEIDQQGTASELAAARTEGLGGAFASLQSTAETLSIGIGRLTSPVLSRAVNAFEGAATGALKFVDALEKLGKVNIPGIGEDVGGLTAQLIRFALISPTEVFGNALKTFGIGIDETAEKLEDLQAQLSGLQTARVAAEAGGAPSVADALTREIQTLRTEIRALKEEAGILVPPQSEAEKNIRNLRKAWQAVNQAREAALGRGVDTSAFDRVLSDLQVKINDATDLTKAEANIKVGFAGMVTSIQAALRVFEIDPEGELADKALANVTRLVRKLEGVAPQAGAAGRKIALTLARAIQDAIVAAAASGNLSGAKALKELAERLAAGFQGDLQSAFGKIKVPLLGDEITAALTPSEVDVARQEAVGTRGGLTAALERRKQIVLDLIETARAEGQDLADLFKELASINNQISSIQDEIAREVEDARKKREEDFFARLEAALRPTQRLLVRAEATEGERDDIRFREALIRRYRNQIEEIKKVLGSTKAAREAISRIQDLILQELQKLKKDRQDFRKELRDALVERLERVQRGIELDIELADINENTKRRIALREQLIQQLKRERKKLRLTGNALKENRNEIARIRAEIDEIKGETKKTGKSFQELTFEFLQTQQGFAANLLGNLIPGFAAGGLVGNVSQVAGAAAAGPREVPRGILEAERMAAIGGARERGVSSGQGSTQIQLLRRIVSELERLNGRTGHPEARYQKITQSAFMDVIGT